MTRGPTLRRIVGFAAPLTAANVLQQGYLLADSIFVGRYVGVTGLAAVGASQPLFYLLNAMFIGIGTAFTIRFAGLTGARDGRHLRDVVRALAVFTVGWTAISIVLATVLARPALALMGIRGHLGVEGAQFLGTLSLGFPAIFGVAALSAFLRGIGASRPAMWIQGIGSLVNVALAYTFVGPLGLGVAGAALATVAASAVALVIGLLYVRAAHPGRRVGPLPVMAPIRGYAALRTELAGATRVGFPLATQHIALAMGIMLLVWIINQFGTVALAAFTVVARLELFTSMVFLDLSGGLTAFVAQNLGAGDDERTRKGLRHAIILTVAMTVVVSAIILILRVPIAALFTHEPATRALTARYIVITYPFFVLYTVMVVVHGYLNGAGRTVIPLICTLVAFVLVQLPTAYLLRRPVGVDGVMWAVVASWTAGLIYTLVSSRRYLLARPRVVRPEVSVGVAGAPRPMPPSERR